MPVFDGPVLCMYGRLILIAVFPQVVPPNTRIKRVLCDESHHRTEAAIRVDGLSGYRGRERRRQESRYSCNLVQPSIPL